MSVTFRVGDLVENTLHERYYLQQGSLDKTPLPYLPTCKSLWIKASAKCINIIPHDTLTPPFEADTCHWLRRSSPPFSGWEPWPQIWMCWLSSQPFHTQLQTSAVHVGDPVHEQHKQDQLQWGIKDNAMYGPRPTASPQCSMVAAASCCGDGFFF